MSHSHFNPPKNAFTASFHFDERADFDEEFGNILTAFSKSVSGDKQKVKVVAASHNDELTRLDVIRLVLEGGERGSSSLAEYLEEILDMETDQLFALYNNLNSNSDT